jgi:glutamate N-acetyltransferase/amino-acid N-acetyltransferase
VFTTNRVSAAPVKLSRRHLKSGRAQAIVACSGIANACTGKVGESDAEEMATLAGEYTGVDPRKVLVGSTGKIGVLLPMAEVRQGIRTAAAHLASDLETDEEVSRAILTTDTHPKTIALSFPISGSEARLGGIAKGAGMIAPRLATMLCFLTTDVEIAPGLLKELLVEAVDSSFNCITVDGHTSTNDTVLILANGMSGTPAIQEGSEDCGVFREALQTACGELAKMIVGDGEGATKLVVITVKGAQSSSDALAVARSIADSPLVKAAVHGESPNWGRIVAATGYVGVPVAEEKMTLAIGGCVVFKDGNPASFSVDGAAEEMRRKQIDFTLDLGMGGESATLWTCDLSPEYVTINMH